MWGEERVLVWVFGLSGGGCGLGGFGGVGVAARMGAAEEEAGDRREGAGIKIKITIKIKIKKGRETAVHCESFRGVGRVLVASTVSGGWGWGQGNREVLLYAEDCEEVLGGGAFGAFRGDEGLEGESDFAAEVELVFALLEDGFGGGGVDADEGGDGGGPVAVLGVGVGRGGGGGRRGCW